MSTSTRHNAGTVTDATEVASHIRPALITLSRRWASPARRLAAIAVIEDARHEHGDQALRSVRMRLELGVALYTRLREVIQ